MELEESQMIKKNEDEINHGGLNNLQGPRLQYKELDVGRCKSMREPQTQKIMQGSSTT